MTNGSNHGLYSCRSCGSKFAPASTGGVCPYCKNSSPELIQFRRTAHRNNQKRRRQLKRAAVRLSAASAVIVVIIAALCVLISGILKNNEALIFDSENNRSSAVFYTDSASNTYYVDSKNRTLLIGKGEVISFATSDTHNSTYLVFNGVRNTDSQKQSYMLIKICGQKLEVISETPYGTIDFTSGGNCDYIYYLTTEELGTYQSSSRLYIYNASNGDIKKINEFENGAAFKNFRVSPNGRYLLYKAEDNGSTKLMRYSVKTAISEPLGIRNAEPVSIDNKGKYYSYIKINDTGTADFYLESSVSDREKTSLDAPFADRILVSADSRSFVIETGNLTTIKSSGSEPCVIAAKTGSGIGLDIIPSLTEIDEGTLIESSVHTLSHCSNKEFFPYYYIGSAGNAYEIMSCTKDGVKKKLTEDTFSDFCTNGKVLAYVSDNKLSTMNVDVKNAAVTVVSENFEGYTLRCVTDDSEYIFYNDNDGNLYRIPFDFNGTNWIKTAVDAYPFIPSREGSRAFYISDNNLYYLRDTKPQMILSDVSAENCYVMNDCKKVYCLTASESTAANSFIVYDGKNTDLITNNAVKLVTAEYLSMNYDSTPFSTYTAPPEHDISSQTDAMVNSVLVPDVNNSADNENVPID